MAFYKNGNPDVDEICFQPHVQEGGRRPVQKQTQQ